MPKDCGKVFSIWYSQLFNASLLTHVVVANFSIAYNKHIAQMTKCSQHMTFMFPKSDFYDVDRVSSEML